MLPTVTHINIVPPIALSLLQSPGLAIADVSSLRCLINAAAPLKQDLADALRAGFGCVVTQWYGMTEASPSVITQREVDACVRGTIGKLLPGMRMRIVDEAGQGMSLCRLMELDLTDACRCTARSTGRIVD